MPPATPGATPNQPAASTPAATPPAATPTPSGPTPQQTTNTSAPVFNSKDESNFNVIPKIPVTPDKVVGFYNQPLIVPQIPQFKFDSIKPTKPKNKTISSYLKSIERKMDTTEKLLKNLLKLQNLQITQEKILNERKRELYSDTFQEYLLDKTVDFKNKKNGDDPDCTCINLPKTPPRPPGPTLTPAAVPTTAPVPTPTPQQQERNQNNAQWAQDAMDALDKIYPGSKRKGETYTPPVLQPTPPNPQQLPEEREIPEEIPTTPELPPVFIPPIPVPLPLPGDNPLFSSAKGTTPAGQQLYITAAKNNSIRTKGKQELRFRDGSLYVFDNGKLTYTRTAEQAQRQLAAAKQLNLAATLLNLPAILSPVGRGRGLRPTTAVPTLARPRPVTPPLGTSRTAPGLTTPPAQSRPEVRVIQPELPGTQVPARNVAPLSEAVPARTNVGPSRIVQPNLMRDARYRATLIKQIKEKGGEVNVDLKQLGTEELRILHAQITGRMSSPPPSIERTIQKGNITPYQEQILNTPGTATQSGPSPAVPKASGGRRDVQLHDASSMNFFRYMSGTGNFASGGLIDMAMNFIKGILPTPKKPKGLRGTPLKRIMHGTKTGVPELIRSGGFKGQTGMLGKGVYGSVKGWVADTYRGAGAFKGILPGQGPRLDLLVPQAAKTLRGATVVTERQANRGLSIAEGILSGKYTGAKAQSLLPLLVKETPTMGQAFLRSLTPLLKMGSKVLPLLNAPVIGDALFPEPTQQYDQLTGPYAAYNNPTLSKKQAADMRAARLETGQNNLSMTTQKTTAPSVIPLPPIDMRIPVKKPPKRDESMLPPEGVDIPNSNVSFINRRTTGASWSSF